VDVLPVHLSGTFDALPPGKSVPRAADLEVRFGQPIAVAELRSRIAGLARSEGYKAATQVIEDAVRTLREASRGERREGTSTATPTATPTSTAPPTSTPTSTPTSRPRPRRRPTSTTIPAPARGGTATTTRARPRRHKDEP
jgi:long-chain acyl-CoA synthetase